MRSCSMRASILRRCRTRLNDGLAVPWHPAAVQVERSRLDVPSALPAEDGRLWPGGKRAGWNRGHDLATGAALNQAARDGEIRRRLAAGESVRAVARALRCGLATVQRARSAVEMRGTAAAASGIVPESGPLQGVLPLP